MIKERYVSFEVAKMLKEKGFDEPCRLFYKNPQAGLYEFKNIPKSYKDIPNNHWFCAPSLYVTMEWLRERLIDIIVFHERLPEDCYWARIEKYPYVEHQQEPIHQTYEAAVEAAILYSLENLI